MFGAKFRWTFWPFLPRNPTFSCGVPCPELFTRTFAWTLPIPCFCVPKEPLPAPENGHFAWGGEGRRQFYGNNNFEHVRFSALLESSFSSTDGQAWVQNETDCQHESRSRWLDNEGKGDGPVFRRCSVVRLQARTSRIALVWATVDSCDDSVEVAHKSAAWMSLMQHCPKLGVSAMKTFAYWSWKYVLSCSISGRYFSFKNAPI